MADIVDKATRSRMMAGIRSKDTQPEMRVRKALHGRGLRYRLHVTGLPGKPDMVFPKYRAIIYIHGCFWHGHSCPFFRLPATRTEFWQNKIGANIARDKRNLEQAAASGWRVLVIWECATRKNSFMTFDGMVSLVFEWLERGGDVAFIDQQGVHSSYV